MADNLPVIGKAYTWYFMMRDATDFETPETGITVTVTASLNGAAFAALTGAPAVTEIASGWYKIVVPASDAAATVLLHATGAGCAPTDERIVFNGDAHQRLTGKVVFSRSAGSISVKQPDDSTQQVSMSYVDIDNDSYSWGS